VEKVDGRRVRGDRTRRRAALCAAQLATVDGLESVTVGRLAADTGLSKSGILTVFPNRTAIQLAAVSTARAIFTEQVVEPALTTTPGVARLASVVDHWFGYVQRRVFPGGCFFVTVANEYGGQHGEVADAIREATSAWRTFIENDLMVEQPDTTRSRELAHRDAFRIDAYMSAANARYALHHDEDDLEMARQVCHELLASRRGLDAGTAHPG
jgi:AcrR family transcriptional regulator